MTPSRTPVLTPPPVNAPGVAQTGRRRGPRPALSEGYFDGQGYHGFPIDRIGVLVIDSLEGSMRGQAVPLRPGDLGPWDMAANGTFYEPSTNTPLGPIIRNGEYLGNHEPKAERRGAVIVLADGTILVSRTDGAGKEDLESTFGSDSNPIQQLVGGGAVLIENGQVVRESDLIDKDPAPGNQSVQKFPATSLENAQFRPTYHTVIATRDGTAYILQNHAEKTGKELQAELHDMHFDTAVKFDGGSGFVYTNRSTPWGGTNSGDRAGRNPTGFGIKTK